MFLKRSARSRRCRSTFARHGVECVEVAVSLPLLMIVTFSTVQICHLMHTEKLLRVASYEAMKAGASRDGDSAFAIRVFEEHAQALGVHDAKLQISIRDFDSAEPGDLLSVEAIAPVKSNRLPAPFNLNLSEFISGGVIQYRKEDL